MLQFLKENRLVRFLYRKALTLRLYPGFVSDFLRFRRVSDGRFALSFRDRYPCLHDRGPAGFDEHYLYHTAWAARILAATRPSLHTDISSCLRFLSIASAFVPIRSYAYQPIDLGLDNLASERADLLALPFEDQSVASLSCMHVLEHVGLGRYGDPLDPKGDLRAMAELCRVLARGGNLLFVVPVGGQPRIQFNAHRIYACGQVLEAFRELRLAGFALVTDEAGQRRFVAEATQEMADAQDYGCGCFWFQRM